MKTILVSESAYIKEALNRVLNESTEINYDRIFIGSKDTSKCKDLLHILNHVDDEACIKKEEALLSLSCIISKCIYIFGNEEDIFLDLYLDNKTIIFIKESINNELLYLPPKVFINERPITYINKEEKSSVSKNNIVSYQDDSNNEDIINNNEIKSEPDKQEISDETILSENIKTTSKERQDEILAITKGISFEKEGYHFSKKQNDTLIKLIKSRKNFTTKEICDVTGLNKVTVYNKRVALAKQKINQDIPSDSKTTKTIIRKKDSTSIAKEEREKELNEIAMKFVPIFDESTKKLSAESKQKLKDLFIDSSRNWSVSEICRATNLKRNIVVDALENKNDENKYFVADLSKNNDVDESDFSYDFSMIDENILRYANQAGIFPSGNIIDDAENVIGVSLSKEDRSALCNAFKDPISNEFDADFIVTLNKLHFTYVNKLSLLQPVFTIYKMLCTKVREEMKEKEHESIGD